MEDRCLPKRHLEEFPMVGYELVTLDPIAEVPDFHINAAEGVLRVLGKVDQGRPEILDRVEGAYVGLAHGRSLRLTLVQVFFNALGLAKEEGNVLVGRVNEAGNDFQRVLEFFHEFVMLAVTPASAQAGKLAMEGAHLAHQIIVELT